MLFSGSFHAGPARPLQGPRAVLGGFCRDPSPRKRCPRSPCPLHSPVGGSQGEGWRPPFLYRSPEKPVLGALMGSPPVREGSRSWKVGSPVSAWARPTGRLGLLPGWRLCRDRLVAVAVTTRPVLSGGLDEGPSLPRLSSLPCALGSRSGLWAPGSRHLPSVGRKCPSTRGHPQWLVTLHVPVSLEGLWPPCLPSARLMQVRPSQTPTRDLPSSCLSTAPRTWPHTLPFLLS